MTISAGLVAAAAAPAYAQTQTQGSTRAAAELRYQIGQMERVLEGAVEHGVTLTRDRLQALAQTPADTLVSDNAHARGFRLEGYGVFFDVVVPSFDATLTWSLRTLDQNDLGLASAVRTLETHVKTTGNPDVEQALKRLELQLNPAVVARTTAIDQPVTSGARNATGSVASVAADPPASNQPVLTTVTSRPLVRSTGGPQPAQSSANESTNPTDARIARYLTLRIAECGMRNPKFNPQSTIRNPQSAIRRP